MYTQFVREYINNTDGPVQSIYDGRISVKKKRKTRREGGESELMIYREKYRDRQR